MRGYEDPSDFSLDRAGCLIEVDQSSSSVGEESSSVVVAATCVSDGWIVVSKKLTTTTSDGVQNEEEEEEDEDAQKKKKKKKFIYRTLDVYDAKNGGKRIRAYCERQRDGGYEFFTSVDVRGDVIVGTIRDPMVNIWREGDEGGGVVTAMAFRAVYNDEDGKTVSHFEEIWRNERLDRRQNAGSLPLLRCRHLGASVICLRDRSNTLVVTAYGEREFAENWILDAESGEVLFATNPVEMASVTKKVWPVVAQVSFALEEGVHAVFARTKDRKRIEYFQATRFFAEKYTASVHDDGEVPQVTRGAEQFIGGMCALPAARKGSANAHPKLCVSFSENSSHLHKLARKKGMARHVVKRDSVVRIVMYNVASATNKQTGSRTIHVEETHRVELEDSIVTSPIDLDSMTASPVSSSYVFFAHVNGDVSVVLPRTGVVLKTLSAAHDPKALASTGSVNFAVADRAFLCASKSASDAAIRLFSSAVQSTSCWSIASPLVWTPKTHHVFPKAFRDAAKTFVCCARLGRDASDTALALLSGASSQRQHALNENRLRMRRKDDQDADAKAMLTEKEFKELIFALVAYEPALIERIVGALAVVTFDAEQ
jgi:hypothetical protein